MYKLYITIIQLLEPSCSVFRHFSGRIYTLYNNVMLILFAFLNFFKDALHFKVKIFNVIKIKTTYIAPSEHYISI